MKNNIQRERERDCAPHLFHTKAETLACLQGHEELHIPPLICFTVGEWRSQPREIASRLDGFGRQCRSSAFAVRSSCSMEDSQESSGAGAFTSVLDVTLETFAAAVEQVIASYGTADAAEQVLVQPMLRDIALSGVIMTRAVADGAPYYVVNYDDSGRTDSVTGGQGASKTVYVFRDAKPEDFDSPRLLRIVELARRIESLTGRDALDIEFCMDAASTLHVLQVRPICTQNGWIPDADPRVRANIAFVSRFLCERMARKPGIFGDAAIFGVMPDWNPAEMIGVTPRRLACSLYRELITRNVWRQAREGMGYRALPPEELMILIAGRPYIDVRLSCNSFLPAGIDAQTGESLVAAWLDRLDRKPALHDKLEFEVAQTCMDFCFDAHLDARYPGALTRTRRAGFRALLQGLTRACMGMGPDSSAAAAFDAVAELRGRQASMPTPGKGTAGEALSHAARLLDECRRFGTLPFSVLARHAFMAESLLRSAVEREALAPERLAAFKASLHTVAGELAADFDAAAEGRRSRESFIHKYGHLRPSTYDILSPSYAERGDLFAQDAPHVAAPRTEASFAFTPAETRALGLLLAEAGLPEDVRQLEAYARRAIPGRETAKFVFSRHVSAILDWIALWGEAHGLDREALSFLDIRSILEWDSQALLADPAAYFQELADEGRRLFDLGRSLKLGYLIRSPRDVAVVAQHRSAPNFVGGGRVEAPVQRLTASTPCAVELDGRIVCIENADPGFDWIFTRHIAGLVTMFGGVNSHMAIRCAEYGLPAAIGVGEALFEQVSNAERCLLQPGGGVLRAVSGVAL
ncbi:MAG: pyruvate, phosphate dikinase [Desulfovibrio desulfuricans]|nr:pyruvate, phosphate dikinase [Desulfovibrio desulfuricans]